MILTCLDDEQFFTSAVSVSLSRSSTPLHSTLSSPPLDFSFAQQLVHSFHGSSSTAQLEIEGIYSRSLIAQSRMSPVSQCSTGVSFSLPNQLRSSFLAFASKFPSCRGVFYHDHMTYNSWLTWFKRRQHLYNLTTLSVYEAIQEARNKLS